MDPLPTYSSVTSPPKYEASQGSMWPRDYGRQTPRMDVAKFYHDFVLTFPLQDHQEDHTNSSSLNNKKDEASGDFIPSSKHVSLDFDFLNHHHTVPELNRLLMQTWTKTEAVPSYEAFKAKFVEMIQNSGSNITTQDASASSFSPNQQQQPRLFHRMSDFLFHKRQGSFGQDDYSEASSSSPSGMVASSIGGGTAPSNYSAMDEDNASRVDSMFSSIQSNLSNMRVNPNTPPPIRTVRLDGGIIHPPSNAPLSPTQHLISTSNINPSTTSPDHDDIPSGLPVDENVGASPSEGFNQAFEKMAHEYGISDDAAKSLSFEAKQVLLRNSQANFQQQNNANGFLSWRTWGIQKKQKQRMDVRQDQFFYPSEESPSSSGDPSGKRNNKRGHNGNSINNGRKKAYSTSARGRPQRTSIVSFNQDNNSNNSNNEPSSSRISSRRYDQTTKKGLSPEYFIHLLKDCHVRKLDESQVQDLRVCLRSVKASWTTQFLHLGGYTILSDLFRQMNQAPKRFPNDDKILQHLAKCFKAIMTHEQAGIAIVLTNPVGLEHIRDLLFGPVNQKQRGLYSLSVITRAHFMNILCTLVNLQTTQTKTVPFIHGYDVLRQLLLDCPGTTKDTLRSITMENNTSATTLTASTETDNDDNQKKQELPFRMTLKDDPQDIMKMVLENDPFVTKDQPLKPRYTAWMRELQYTVEKEIEPITFLAQVLDYKFESAFRQLRIKPPTQQHHSTEDMTDIDQPVGFQEEGTSTVMVDDGVVEYLISHLRLINTIVATPPTFYSGVYNDRDREKVRLEIMLSGFDKIAKALQGCPHPTLYAFYFRYLQPLLQPITDLNTSSPSDPHYTTTTPSQSDAASVDNMVRWEDDVRQAGNSGILFDQPSWENDAFDTDEDDSNDYEDYDDSDDEDLGTESIDYSHHDQGKGVDSHP
ncbi:hypothetical protein BC941DRAFT_516672 [Chlamydoabsidia padenii]|nr:hypothetical protein BC941DRAFT_516672 [Chlamydoabsidia padenii]